MQMCDGCVDLEGTGEQQACVAACPQRALEFGDVEEMRAKHGDAVRGGFEPLVDPAITQPYLLVTPHPKANIPRSAERPGVKECVCTCIFRWSLKQKKKHIT